MTAERRRLLGVERVTRYKNGAITCTYTGWGGLEIGRAEGTVRAGSSWEDGWWPKLFLRIWAP